jgi:hypothetical protein
MFLGRSHSLEIIGYLVIFPVILTTFLSVYLGGLFDRIGVRTSLICAGMIFIGCSPLIRLNMPIFASIILIVVLRLSVTYVGIATFATVGRYENSRFASYFWLHVMTVAGAILGGPVAGVLWTAGTETYIFIYLATVGALIVLLATFCTRLADDGVFEEQHQETVSHPVRTYKVAAKFLLLPGIFVPLLVLFNFLILADFVRTPIPPGDFQFDFGQMADRQRLSATLRVYGWYISIFLVAIAVGLVAAILAIHRYAQQRVLISSIVFVAFATAAVPFFDGVWTMVAILSGLNIGIAFVLRVLPYTNEH